MEKMKVITNRETLVESMRFRAYVYFACVNLLYLIFYKGDNIHDLFVLLVV